MAAGVRACLLYLLSLSSGYPPIICNRILTVQGGPSNRGIYWLTVPQYARWSVTG